MSAAATPPVIVTGASSGIGLETAVGLAREGYRVVATVRDLGRTQPLDDAAAAAGVELDVRRLDVTDEASVAELVDGVVATYGGLHGLVNNAGAAHLGTVELDTMEAIRAAFEVNFFGVVVMTRAAMPHLRASSGVLVTISSVGGIVGQPFNEAYCGAKFAVEGFMEGLAPVAATVGVRVVVVEPGAVASSFVANAGVDPAGDDRRRRSLRPGRRGLPRAHRRRVRERPELGRRRGGDRVRRRRPGHAVPRADVGGRRGLRRRQARRPRRLRGPGADVVLGRDRLISVRLSACRRSRRCR